MFSQKAFPGEGKSSATPSIFKTAKRLSVKVYIFVCIDDSARYNAEMMILFSQNQVLKSPRKKYESLFKICYLK
jgi:hypothetical protein